MVEALEDEVVAGRHVRRHPRDRPCRIEAPTSIQAAASSSTFRPP